MLKLIKINAAFFACLGILLLSRPVQAASILSVYPNNLPAGTTTDVVIDTDGTNLATSTTDTSILSFTCGDISVNSLTVSSSTELIANISIASTTNCLQADRNSGLQLLDFDNTPIPAANALQITNTTIIVNDHDPANTPNPYPETEGHPFRTFMEGINDANPYDTVLVYPGDNVQNNTGWYYESVYINKPLTLRAAFAATSTASVTLVGDLTTADFDSGNPNAITMIGGSYLDTILIRSGGVTLDGLRIAAPSADPNLAAPYNGVQIDTAFDHTTTIKNCVFEGSFLNAIYVSYSDHILIENNKISEINGDYPFGSKVGIRMLFTDTLNTLVRNNLIANNNYAENFDQGDPFSTPRNYGVLNESLAMGNIIEAADNWWGDNSGPQNDALNGAAIGDPISGNVKMSPWCSNDACDQFAQLAVNSAADLFTGDPSTWTLRPLTGDPLTDPISELVATQQLDLNLPTTGTSSEQGTTTISIPKDTSITRTDGQVIDPAQISATTMNIAELSGYDGTVLSTPIQWGLPGISMTFSPAITINLWVGTAYNGLTLNVLHSNSTSSDWTTEGIASSTCLVADGYCSFETTKASYFIAETPPAPVSSTTTDSTTTSPSTASTGGSSVLPMFLTSSINNTATSTSSSTPNSSSTPIQLIDDGLKISQQVLGVKIYANNTLLRDRKTKRIYLINKGKKTYIRNLIELSKYRGQKIINETSAVLAQYKNS